tara:strand:+ start:348 stop:878 length:531 start_codon:yes stop_codon:yes gene_type:complete
MLMQQFDLVEWGGRMDWDITLFPETGSGMKKTRPVLESLMNALRRKEFEALVVWKLDRLARSVSHLVSIYEELNELGIKLYSYKEPEINPETAMGKAMIGVMAVMAQLERDFISERTKAGLHAKKKMGKVLGRPKAKLPLGLLENLWAGSIRNIASKYGVSRMAVQRLRAAHTPPP